MAEKQFAIFLTAGRMVNPDSQIIHEKFLAKPLSRQEYVGK